MIADIFYPICTLTITILACFTRKKKTKIVWGFVSMLSPGHHPRPPGGWGGVTAPPQTPSCNRYTHIFSVLSPGNSFWTIFWPFTPLTAQKMKISKKCKKQLEISSFYTSVPTIMIRLCTVPEIWCMTDRWTDKKCDI